MSNTHTSAPLLTDDELADVLDGAAARPMLQVRQRTSEHELAARQLAVLSSTYPGWEISYDTDSSGRQCWTAELVGEITDRMRAAGVVKHLRREGCPELASALGRQAVLIHTNRVNFVWVRPGPS